MAAALKEKKPQAPEVGLGVGPLLNAAAYAQAQNQAPDSIPAMTKPGEFILPPDTVHALGGKAVLQHAVNQTHTPSNAGAQVPLGFKPELFFANGGAPEDELKKASNFGDAAAAASSAGVTQVSPTPAPAPAATTMPKSQQLEANMTMGPPSTRKDLVQMQQEWRGVQQAQTNERYDAAGAQMAQEARDAAATRQNRAATRPLYGADTPAVSAGEKALANYDAANPNTAPKPLAPPIPPGYGHFNQGEGPAGPPNLSGLGTGPLLNPTPPAASPAASTPSNFSGGVTRSGNSYSGTNVAGDITINGTAPRNGGAISAQNDLAATNLAAAGANAQMFRDHAARQGPGQSLGVAPLLAAANGQGPVEPGSFTGGVSGVIGQQSGNGNMWSRTPEQQRRDAEVQASSIHKPTAAIGANAIRSMDAQDLEGVRGVNALQREGMQQQGANFRAAVQQAGENARAGQRTAIEQQRLGMEQTTAGFSNRAAKQMEDLRGVLANPNATPEQRQQATQTILALQGKQPQNEWGVQVTPTTKNLDGSTSMGSIVKYNKATGQTEVVGQQGQGSTNQAPYPDGQELTGKDGKTYVVKNGVPVLK